MPKVRENDKPLTLGLFLKFTKAQEKRFDKIDQRFNQNDQRFDNIALRFDHIDQRFDEIKTEIGDLRQLTLGGFDDLYKKFEDLRQEYIVTNHQMKRMEKSGESVQQDVLKIKAKLIELQEKIEAIEKQLPRQ